MNESPEIVELDQIDKQILKILQDDAKASLREIESQIKLSPTSIRLRIDRLKNKNVIKKFTTLIDCRHIGYREMVMISLRVNSTRSLKDLKSRIEEMNKVKYAYIVTGEYPLFVMAKCLDHSDSLDLIEDLRNLPGVEELKTQIVLDRIKEDPSIIIPD